MSASAGIQSREDDMPGRVVRHRLIDRIFHWLMAAAVLTLMATAFLPILDVKFQWLDIHWMTGVLLAALVCFHILRALIWQDWRNMWIGPADVREIWRDFCRVVGSAGHAARSGKYDALQKVYHLAIAVLVLSAVGSGLLMLLKIDTPLWRRDPYWFSNHTWGIIYVIHGFAAMALVTMVMIHVYFALRPDEWHLTRAMIRGWISRDEFDQHYDSERWKT
jgi:cytochrome b subunit of formate dehydrogenase